MSRQVLSQNPNESHHLINTTALALLTSPATAHRRNTSLPATLILRSKSLLFHNDFDVVNLHLRAQCSLDHHLLCVCRSQCWSPRKWRLVPREMIRRRWSLAVRSQEESDLAFWSQLLRCSAWNRLYNVVYEALHPLLIHPKLKDHFSWMLDMIREGKWHFWNNVNYELKYYWLK